MAGTTNILTSKDFRMTQEGRRWSANNATPGTGLALHAAATTYDETKPCVYLANTAPASDPNSPTLYPQLLRLTSTAAGVGGTGARYTFSLDAGDLFTSGGADLTVKNCNAAFRANPTQWRAKAGAVVCSAATSGVQLVANVAPRPTLIDIIGDTLEFVFGSAAPTTHTTTNQFAATAMFWSASLPMIGIPPGWCLKVVEWRASQSGAISAEVALDWFAFTGE